MTGTEQVPVKRRTRWLVRLACWFHKRHLPVLAWSVALVVYFVTDIDVDVSEEAAK